MRSRAKHEGGGVPVWSGLSEGTFFTGTATGAQARTTGDTRETARLRGAVETEPSLEYVQCGLVVGIVITYTLRGDADRTRRSAAWALDRLQRRTRRQHARRSIMLGAS